MKLELYVHQLNAIPNWGTTLRLKLAFWMAGLKQLGDTHLAHRWAVFFRNFGGKPWTFSSTDYVGYQLTCVYNWGSNSLMYYDSTTNKWRFPEKVVPLNHPLFWWDFPMEINQPFWDTPMTMGFPPCGVSNVNCPLHQIRTKSGVIPALMF